MDLLVVWQGRDVEGLCGSWAQGDRVCLLLGHEGSPMCLIHIKTECGGQTVRNHKGQVLQALQLTGLLVADLQTYSIVPLLQLKGILKEENRQKGDVLIHAHQEFILLIHNHSSYYSCKWTSRKEKHVGSRVVPGVDRHPLSPIVSCSDQTASRADYQTLTHTAAHTTWDSWGSPPHSQAEDRAKYQNTCAKRNKDNSAFSSHVRG